MSRKYDPMEEVLVQQAAIDSLDKINAGMCDDHNFPQIEPGIDKRVRSATKRFTSGVAIFQVRVDLIEDTASAGGLEPPSDS